MDDETIFQLIESSLKEWYHMASFHPSLFRIFRYREAIPQYGADCEARFTLLDRLHEQYPTLHIGGNLRGGIGMADRMKQGKQLADEVIASIGITF
jgi:oxygen-dependent protoporphyrinogen oxidase